MCSRYNIKNRFRSWFQIEISMKCRSVNVVTVWRFKFKLAKMGHRTAHRVSVPLNFETLQKNWELHFLQASRFRGYLQQHTRLVYAKIFLKTLFCLFPCLSDLLPSAVFLLTRIIKTCLSNKGFIDNIKRLISCSSLFSVEVIPPYIVTRWVNSNF